MLRYTVNRMFTAAILMVMASVFAFLIVAAFPGNVAALIAELLGGFVSQDVVDKVAEEYRLNDPLIARYGYWVADVLNGNLGRSFRTGEEVTVELLERLRPTFALLVGGSIVTLVVAVSLGFLGALWPGGFIDRAIRGIAVVNISIPKFFLAAAADSTCSAWCSTFFRPSGSAGPSPGSCPRLPSGWCRARC